MSDNTKANEAVPNFFIVGFPKCGTTSLSSYIAEHPDIFYAKCYQEPAFFHKDFSDTKRKYTNIDDYLHECYSGSESYDLAGESTPLYVYSDTAVQEILSLNLNAKFIVIVRDVVDMLSSLHAHNYFYGNEIERSFATAWKRSVKQVTQYNAGNKGNDFICNYALMGRMGYYTEKLVRTVPKQNLLLLHFTELQNNPETTYNRVLYFLGAKYYEIKNFSNQNPAKGWRYGFLRHIIPKAMLLKQKLGIKQTFGVAKLLRDDTKSVKKDVSTELRGQIENYFQEDQQILGNLITQHAA